MAQQEQTSIAIPLTPTTLGDILKPFREAGMITFTDDSSRGGQNESASDDSSASDTLHCQTIATKDTMAQRDETSITLPLSPTALEDVLKTLREAGNTLVTDDSSLTDDESEPESDEDRPSEEERKKVRDAGEKELLKHMPAGFSYDDLLLEPEEKPIATDSPDYLDAWLNGVDARGPITLTPKKATASKSARTSASPSGIVKRRSPEKKEKPSPKKVDFMQYQYEREFASANMAAFGVPEVVEMQVIDFVSLGIDMGEIEDEEVLGYEEFDVAAGGEWY